MPPPDDAVVAVRRAVRAALAATPPGSPVAAAVSGGADSLALLAALAREAPKAGRSAAAVTVDHGLHSGSAEQAARVVAQAASLGVPCATLTVSPDGSDEAAARTARYAALDAWASANGVAAVLLGHTRDDQAEQVLLGLARGSGARSLAGIPPARGPYLRPLLDVPRATTVAACAALGLTPWEDPANADARHARARVRHVVLPILEEQLGPGVTAALARTARLLRDDADALDALAAAHASLAAADLAALPAAVRSRVLRRAAIDAGAPANDLTAEHVSAIEAFVTDWHGQREVALPGGLVAERRCDTLAFRRRPEPTGGAQ
ncbi:MAG TPA: tRNA lysidine(34) synthetase TilS [Frankiaceae bacterium]|jgi:tRNA(Ile)-lysidine synthase|nr:tRNA lysidine(34) synthetase TilS [Frankiaceae bacterium]